MVVSAESRACITPRSALLGALTPMQALSDRFWGKVENSSGASCWQWLNATDKDGYGKFRIFKNGKLEHKTAHRVAWELRCGLIPEGMCVLHRCDNRGCCNPSHLFLGDDKINVEDKVAKGRQAKGERNGNHKLTRHSIPYIRLLAAAGATQRFIANRYGVSPFPIHDILRGKAWRESESDRCATEEFWSGMFSS